MCHRVSTRAAAAFRVAGGLGGRALAIGVLWVLGGAFPIVGQTAPDIEEAAPPFVETIAGLGITGSSDAPSGPALAARFYRPEGIAVDAAGDLILADTENRLIRRITPDGRVTTIAGSRTFFGYSDGVGTNASFGGPSSVAVDSDGVIYVSDSSYQLVRRIAPDGRVTTIAGQLGVSGFADGKGNAARFNIPAGVAVDAQRNVYVADRRNHLIRRISPEGEVRRIAGQPREPGFRDGPDGVARLHEPTAVAVSEGGNQVYFADTVNNAIRRIEPDGSVVTIAGLRGRTGYRDGSGLESMFNYPRGLAVDSEGNIFVADTANQVVRKVVAATGAVTTVAGLYDQVGHYDGTGESARFNEPRGIALAPDGTLVVADTWNHQVRRLRPGSMVGTFSVDSAVGKPGVPWQVKFEPTSPAWGWSWVNRPQGSKTPLPPAGSTQFVITPDEPGLYTLRAAVSDETMAPGWRHLDLMAVAGRQLGFPVFTPGGRVSIPVAGGPGIAVQLEGLFSGRWLALTNRPIPQIEGEIQDPLTRDPVGRIYRVRYLAAP